MIHLITPRDLGGSLDVLAAMHRLRYRVFKDRLDWDVQTSGDFEVDQYDALSPVYIVHTNDDGEVDGCVRLLPLTGPTMICDTFPALLGGRRLPADSGVWECSRFAVDTQACVAKGPVGLTEVTSALMAGVQEFCLSQGAREVVAVIDVRFERILRRAGCTLRRAGEPQTLGVTRALAVHVEISEPARQRILDCGGLTGPVLPPAVEFAVAA